MRRSFVGKRLDDLPILSRLLPEELLVSDRTQPPGTDRRIHEIAYELRLSPSTTHRYVRTLLEIGLLEQSPQTRKYRIPPQEHAAAPGSDAAG